MENDFYTLKGYELSENKEITYAMEDYLEMICRFSENNSFARVVELSHSLNVKPSSVSKMTAKLKKLGLVEYEKYGYIRLTDEGRKKGKYYIYRHEVLQKFLCLVNGSSGELEQVEKIEHFLNMRTVKNIDRLISFYKNITQ